MRFTSYSLRRRCRYKQVSNSHHVSEADMFDPAMLSEAGAKSTVVFVAVVALIVDCDQGAFFAAPLSRAVVITSNTTCSIPTNAYILMVA